MSIFHHQCRASALRCAKSAFRPRTTSSLVLLCGLKRTFATHRDDLDFSTRGSPLSNTLDSKRGAEPKHESVGPFQLGLSQQALRTGKKIPKWSELDTKGKALRATARTTNLGVILLGAGLSALLIYSLTSELFSKNSATVLYGDACERIKASPKVAKYLNGPLTFHNNPPSSIRPRHRNRHVTSQVVRDAYGQEHMILSFYVKGRPEGAEDSDLSYMETAERWVQDKSVALPDLKFEDIMQWSKEFSADIWDKSIQAFRYLSGAPPPPAPSPPVTERQALEQPQKKDSSAWDFVGMFSGLRGQSRKGTGSTGEEHRTFLEGDVHADLVRNKDGYFVFRYLLVDIPSSRDPNAVRVWVERAPSVRDNEPVMRWVSS
ncbi:hypothetical protein FA13DRAFT_1725330 [Coprinellus micaceus]|uniref:Mitochondrial import inner membrane translocase subunit Tim21 n=1 Tax=Coprinellus micaceus TaxID=71717 RepID=A0A4Y7TYU8_COPMI|nr:hypothetical protein FA13DRAFT_1725330 [Coprinellus micaceus]